MTTNTDTAVVATLDDAPLAAAADTLAASGPALELADMAPGPAPASPTARTTVRWSANCKKWMRRPRPCAKRA
ncbi:hypothetical protein [Cupriavidus basilensis]